MALISPGVQVSVIDESFYTPAEPGTRPLFIVATAQDKTNGAGTGTAQGTLAINAGKVYTITSQRDLVDTFGDPVFKVDANNNPVHAGEQNEYGLQAAYSYLGVSNSALVVRANIDLNLLDAQADAPGGEPQDGTFWLDSGSTQFGIFEWNGAAATITGGQTYTTKTPSVVLDASAFTTAYGSVGDYAIVPGSDTVGETVDDRDSHVLKLYYKSRFSETGINSGSATWVQVGTPGWLAAWPTVQSTLAGSGWDADTDAGGPDTGDSFWINTVRVYATGTTISSLVTNVNNAGITGVKAREVDGYLQLYVTSSGVESITIENEGSGTILSRLGIAEGTYYVPNLAMSKHTEVPLFKRGDTVSEDDVTEMTYGRPTGSVWIKTTEPNAGAKWKLKQYNANTKLWTSVDAPLYPTSAAALAEISPTQGGLNVPLNSAYVQYNFNGTSSDSLIEADFRVMRRARTGTTVVRSKAITANTLTGGTYTFNIGESVVGSSATVNKEFSVAVSASSNDALSIATAINSPVSGPFTNIVASVSADNRVVITHKTGGEILFADSDDEVDFLGTQLGLTNVAENLVYQTAVEDGTYAYVASNWVPLTITPDTATRVLQSYYIQDTAPQILPADGTLWYSSVVDEVDIMVHNGKTWVGYQNYLNLSNADGPIVSASQPTSRTDGAANFVTGDLWIDTSDIENYPLIKRYNADYGRWETVDSTDQTTENGVLFADARWSTAGADAAAATIGDLLTSNYLDVDAPDPALYPKGMLLWNLRRSGFNVKKFVRNYVDLNSDNERYDVVRSPSGQRATTGESQAEYYPHRWVTTSANQADGSGSFGRKAQRQVIITALQALANENQEIRDTERNSFNLLACPGYPELIGEMVSLNYDRDLTAFIVGDCPARLTPDATSINNWGTNLAGSLQDNDKGLVTFDEYMGVFYPWGYSSDNAGNDIAVPPSHMICRMIALSDQVSYPWFAPAGTRRGGITNATNVGYITSEGEFQAVSLNEGQRDTLYNVKVNPITYFTGAGLVNFGQKTRAKNASALDRINVARLVIYLRSQLNKLAKPYIFEPNDKITRDEIKQQVESLLLELVGQRALYDFLVVCDESNNTPNRIDRNELYVDIAIEPVKAVEFIYIPLRLKNTGEIAALG